MLMRFHSKLEWSTYPFGDTQIEKYWKILFLAVWPWPLTLTIKLGLDFIKVHMPTTFCVHMWMTNGHTDGTDSITSTADAGGNEQVRVVSRQLLNANNVV